MKLHLFLCLIALTGTLLGLPTVSDRSETTADMLSDNPQIALSLCLSVNGPVGEMLQTFLTRQQLINGGLTDQQQIDDYNRAVEEYIALKSRKNAYAVELEEILVRLQEELHNLQRLTHPHFINAFMFGKPLTSREERVLSQRSRPLRKNDGTAFACAPQGIVAEAQISIEDFGLQVMTKTCDISLSAAITSVKAALKGHIIISEGFEERHLELCYSFYRCREPNNLEKALHFSKLRAQLTENKAYWRNVYRGHLQELTAVHGTEQEAAADTSEAEAAQAARYALVSAAAAQAQQEEKERKALIRQLRREQEETTATAATVVLQNDNPVTTTAKKVIIPSEILWFYDQRPVVLEKEEQQKYDAAIAAITKGEEPTDFRGSIKIKGLNILHCGISEAKRIYYILKNGKAYILDVSNHDMHALNAAVQRFKKSTGQ